MISFLYLNYGPRETFRQELKYSFLTLRPFVDPKRHRIVIYTDAPDRYAGWPATIVSIAGRIDEYSLGGRLHHRIKPVIVLDALKRFADAAIFLDADSIVLDGFVAGVAEKIGAGGIMNRFEFLDPLPQLAGFETVLPHAGPYRYDSRKSRMYNSGLIGARADHMPVMADAIALTDALLDQPIPQEQVHRLEQLAIAEAFRVHGIPIGEIHDRFIHYWRRSWRRYAAWRLPKILSADWNDLRVPDRQLRFNPLSLHLCSQLHSARKRLSWINGS